MTAMVASRPQCERFLTAPADVRFAPFFDQRRSRHRVAVMADERAFVVYDQWLVTGRSRRVHVRSTTHMNGGSWPGCCLIGRTSSGAPYEMFVQTMKRLARPDVGRRLGDRPFCSRKTGSWHNASSLAELAASDAQTP